MKKLIFINGTMGVGKTATSKELQEIMPKNVFLDGDYCWDMNPFVVTDETKAMVLENITYLLNSFISCSVYENIIFCWVMHEEQIIESILSKLDLADIQVQIFSLICSPDQLICRLNRDIQEGKRTAEIIGRSQERLPCYQDMNSTKIDVSDITASQAARKILEYL